MILSAWARRTEGRLKPPGLDTIEVAGFRRPRAKDCQGAVEPGLPQAVDSTAPDGRPVAREARGGRLYRLAANAHANATSSARRAATTAPTAGPKRRRHASTY